MASFIKSAKKPAGGILVSTTATMLTAGVWTAKRLLVCTTAINLEWMEFVV